MTFFSPLKFQGNVYPEIFVFASCCSLDFIAADLLGMMPMLGYQHPLQAIIRYKPCYVPVTSCMAGLGWA